MKPLQNRHKNQRGFSLIELMIVIAIIGILIAVGITGYKAAMRAANEAAAVKTLRTIAEQQMLEILALSPLNQTDLFLANARKEEAVFMGDVVFFSRLDQLVNAARPLVERVPSNGALRLTEHGLQVLAAKEDAIELNGIDRWIGGVHLTPHNLWRRQGDTLVRG